MDVAAYFRSINIEMGALKGRVRQLIQDSHWQTDGEWKESVLRTILKRHMPSSISVGRGFVVGMDKQSTQIDVILYDNTKPLLHQDGDLVFVTPDAVKGIIEVKATLRTAALAGAITKLADNANLLRPNAFTGLFSFDVELGQGWSPTMCAALNDAAQGLRGRVVNHICAGPRCLAKYWENHPQIARPRWHTYEMNELAAGYFIANCIESVASESVRENFWAWYPLDGKEVNKVGEIDLALRSNP